MAGIEENEQELILLYDPFVVLCDDGVELRANSGRVNRTPLRNVYLLGDVFFQDSAQTLTANEARYDPDEAYLWARGNVVYIDRREGSTLRGPELEYYRVTDDRPAARMTATGRPTLTMVAAEGADASDPLELTSDRIEMVGEDDLTATGNVIITREDLRATGEEARYSSVREELLLRSNAVIRSGEFELRGDSVDARLLGGSIEFLHSRTSASLSGDELQVSGDDLQLFFADDLLQRVIARVEAGAEWKARAVSSTFQLEADSLDARFIEQRLDEVHAVGRAFGESIDTTTALVLAVDDAEANGENVVGQDILARDWIRGDSIIGYFVPVERDADGDPVADDDLPPDPEDPAAGLALETATDEDPNPRESVELRRLVARGSAQSLYRMPPTEGLDPSQRNVNFLVGRVIELNVVQGELEVATVEGLQYGVYLEAQPLPAPADTGDEGDEETGADLETPDAGGA